jgi:hypothetical protein
VGGSLPRPGVASYGTLSRPPWRQGLALPGRSFARLAPQPLRPPPPPPPLGRYAAGLARLPPPSLRGVSYGPQPLCRRAASPRLRRPPICGSCLGGGHLRLASSPFACPRAHSFCLAWPRRSAARLLPRVWAACTSVPAECSWPRFDMPTSLTRLVSRGFCEGGCRSAGPRLAVCTSVPSARGRPCFAPPAVLGSFRFASRRGSASLGLCTCSCSVGRGECSEPERDFPPKRKIVSGRCRSAGSEILRRPGASIKGGQPLVVPRSAFSCIRTVSS